MNRSGLVGPQGTTEQPFLLGQKMDEKENASVDPVGQYINSARRGEPVDRLGPVGPWSAYEQPGSLGLVTDDRGNAPTGPVAMT